LKVKVLYFARLREAFDLASEEVTLPEGTCDVAALTTVLRARGGVWAKELAAGRAFRVAVDQDMAQADTPLSDAAEVAIFPPVTGG